MYYPPESSEPPLDQTKEVDKHNTKLRTAFNKKVHRHKWLVSHITFSDKLDILHSEFVSVEARS